MQQDQGKVLLVEGRNDKVVLDEFLHSLEIPCPSIMVCGSDKDVFKTLKLCLDNPTRTRSSVLSLMLMQEAENALVNVEKRGVQQYSEAHRPKAKIHTFLAWQKEPGASLREAISWQYLDTSSEKARPFINWINRLFWE